MHKSPATKALDKQLRARGLRGGDYRTEVVKAFKKA
jgi:hypothetical protein